MYTIKTLNAISPVGLAKLPANQFEIDNEAAAPQGILVRSADMHDAPLPDSLLAIARAGAGTNNIPVEDCTNKGIVVFNTPGANANAVAELVVGALVAGSRNLVDAVNWAQTLKGRDTIAKDVEKGKKAFVGPELRGKTLGVIGLGAIGARVANAAVALGMEVLGYDPYISIDAAWSLSRSVQHCVTLGDMLPRCDYLTIHVPYLPTTRHTINAQTLAMCKDGVRVLNFARGELVDNAALLDALNSGKVAQYFCDFPTEELLGVKGVCCTPHLGASTPESETNCAVMAAAELSDYLDTLTDRIEGVLHRLYFDNIREMRPDALKMVEMIVRGCDAMREVVGELAQFKKSKTLRQRVVELNTIEEEADALYMRAMRELHTTCTDPVEIICWREVYFYLEKCTDACEHVADVVEQIVMKNS